MTRKLTPLQAEVLLNSCYIKGSLKNLGWRQFTEFFIGEKLCTSTVSSCLGKRWIEQDIWKIPFYQRKFRLTALGTQMLIENGWTT